MLLPLCEDVKDLINISYDISGRLFGPPFELGRFGHLGECGAGHLVRVPPSGQVLLEVLALDVVFSELGRAIEDMQTGALLEGGIRSGILRCCFWTGGQLFHNLLFRLTGVRQLGDS